MDISYLGQRLGVGAVQHMLFEGALSTATTAKYMERELRSGEIGGF